MRKTFTGRLEGIGSGRSVAMEKSIVSGRSAHSGPYGISCLVKTLKSSSSARNGFFDEFTAATPTLISSGMRASSGGNDIQRTPSWLTLA